MYWIISDTHFGHTNIIKYCDRPFKTVEEMDTTIINNINEKVKKTDILWHLGDFLYGRSELDLIARYKKYLSLINCKNIILIVGNHDKYLRKESVLREMFIMVLPYFVGYINGLPLTMNHRPLDDEKHNKQALITFRYKKMDCINLFGHTHNNSHLTPYNMSVENTNYKPVSLKEIQYRPFNHFKHPKKVPASTFIERFTIRNKVYT